MIFSQKNRENKSLSTESIFILVRNKKLFSFSFLSVIFFQHVIDEKFENKNCITNRNITNFHTQFNFFH